MSTGSDVKLSPGGPAELLKISETEALVETAARLAVGTSLALCIGGSRPQRLPGRVVRCQVCGIHRDNTMTYQVTVAFESATADVSDLQAKASDPPASDAMPPPPAMEQAVEPELVNEW